MSQSLNGNTNGNGTHAPGSAKATHFRELTAGEESVRRIQEARDRVRESRKDLRRALEDLKEAYGEKATK